MVPVVSFQQWQTLQGCQMPHRKPITLVWHAPQSERKKGKKTFYSFNYKLSRMYLPSNFLLRYYHFPWIQYSEIKSSILLSLWQGESLGPEVESWDTHGLLNLNLEQKEKETENDCWNSFIPIVSVRYFLLSYKSSKSCFWAFQCYYGSFLFPSLAVWSFS